MSAHDFAAAAARLRWLAAASALAELASMSATSVLARAPTYHALLMFLCPAEHAYGWLFGAAKQAADDAAVGLLPLCDGWRGGSRCARLPTTRERGDKHADWYIIEIYCDSPRRSVLA